MQLSVNVDHSSLTFGRDLRRDPDFRTCMAGGSAVLNMKVHCKKYV